MIRLNLVCLSMVTALTCTMVPVAQGNPSQLEPIIVTATSSNGSSPPRGWQVSDKQADFDRYFVPKNPALMGARIFLAEASSSDLVNVLNDALVLDDFDSIQVQAEAPINNLRMIDAKARGRAFIGSAQSNGERYRFSAVGFYGTVDGEPRYTSTFVFAAPDDIFIRMGGFVPVSSNYFQLNGSKISDLIIKLGKADPDTQVTQLANATDIYLRKLTQSSSAPVSNDLTIFNSVYGQCTGVSGSDPDAYGWSGLGNPDC